MSGHHFTKTTSRNEGILIMRILQYNIWDGCHEPERYEQLHHLLVEQSYDVVGFNELTNWTTEMFTNTMTDIGYEYSTFFAMETSNYPIGIASKQPIDMIVANEDDPFHHGMLHVKTAGIHFVMTHFSPFSSEHKEREADYIARYIKDIKEPLMLMGDLNTLSPLDRKHYEDMDMLEQLRKTKNPWSSQTKDGIINYKPMEKLLNTGLTDICYSEELAYSMPTKVHANYKERRYVRLDYMLVNDAVLKYKPQANMIHNHVVDYISDHYPIECHLDLP